MQISFVMLIFLLFSDQILWGQKSLSGENCLKGAPPSPAVEESQSTHAEFSTDLDFLAVKI